MSRLAIHGGTPIRQQPYPGWPVWDEHERDALITTLESGRWGGNPYPGPQTERFTQRFAEMQGGDHAVAMMNGTVTLVVALQAVGIGWGDEVIVPAYTFQATALAPILAGAVPVVVDVDPDTYCIDVDAAAGAISERTRAIIPVHLGAQMADMDALLELAEKHNLIVIEDCAHAHGARWRGRGAGSIGHFGSFSMQSSKILTAGEGGVLLCRTEELAQRATSLIDCGRPADSAGEMFSLGANYRMSEFQAAILNVALDRFPEQAAAREAMINYMDEQLVAVPGVQLLERDLRHTTRSFYRYIFKIDSQVFGAEKTRVCEALHAEGIPCLIGYPAMHQYDLFQPTLSKLPVPVVFPERFQFETMHHPVAEGAANHEAIWLDECVFRDGERGIDDVVAAVRKVRQGLSEGKPT
jgi:dTDP-4-amino-4,6-dideoxygalactose transaminase